VNPRLRSLLARVTLIGGVAVVVALVGRSAPREQSLSVALGSLKVSRLEAVVTRVGDTEPTAGFSQDFPGPSPRTVRHAFSAPDGTYIVVITLRHRPEVMETDRGGDGAPPTNQEGGAIAPTKPETSFERRVSLGDGEVTVSPD
jgi:hypothetical protein